MRRGGQALCLALGSSLSAGCTVSIDGGAGHLALTFGAGTFVLANVLYFKWRREGNPNLFKRMVAFLLGLPLSVVTWATVEIDTGAANRLFLASRDEDDPESVAEDLERGLEWIRRHKIGTDPEEPSEPPAP